METGGASRPLHVLLTGPPGIGKTTVCKKIASALEKKGNKFEGFYTEEVRDRNGSRIGFDIVGVKDPGRRLPLARLKNLTEAQKASKYQVGNYLAFSWIISRLQHSQYWIRILMYCLSMKSVKWSYSAKNSRRK